MAAKNATKQGKIGVTVAKAGQKQFKNKQNTKTQNNPRKPWMLEGRVVRKLTKLASGIT